MVVLQLASRLLGFAQDGRSPVVIFTTQIQKRLKLQPALKAIADHRDPWLRFGISEKASFRMKNQNPMMLYPQST